MSRKLSLSQAARMIGLTRKDLQAKIQEGGLVVMEGTVDLDDLKLAYPDAEYEDNTIIDRMQIIMDNAIHKMAESEHEDAQIDVLGKRLFLVNQELSKEKSKAEFYEELINKLKHKFIEISKQQIDKTQVIALQKWLLTETADIQEVLDDSSHEMMENQIQQLMLPHVRLLPSMHDFVSDKTETLLESALHAGLAVDYGCNNGKCGKCKMKLISGKVEQSKQIDFVLSREEKNQNYILSCAHKAVTDIVLETSEAVSADDIPLQTITTKIKKLDLVNDEYYILSLKTPRSQRLRFLAGQEMMLSIESKGEQFSYHTSIASCPCDDMNIQFHFRKDLNNPFLIDLIENEPKNLLLNGPDGYFTLDETSPKTMVFIAMGFGFSNIKSLIEHALALDMEETIHLYWIVKDDKNLYMKNLCRSWNDALDNFIFHPIVCEQDSASDIEKIISNVLTEMETLDSLVKNDYYISGTENIANIFTQQLVAVGCCDSQIHCKVFKPD